MLVDHSRWSMFSWFSIEMGPILTALDSEMVTAFKATMQHISQIIPNHAFIVLLYAAVIHGHRNTITLNSVLANTGAVDHWPLSTSPILRLNLIGLSGEFTPRSMSCVATQLSVSTDLIEVEVMNYESGLFIGTARG